jgi:flagellar L-ring protein precursor FlgH
MRSTRNKLYAVVFGVFGIAVSSEALSEQLFNPNASTALISDRRAALPGDLITVLITENSSATNSATTSTAKGIGLGGQLTSLKGHQAGAQGSLNNSFDGQGSVERSGKVLAQISVRVESVMPNGDLLVAGTQAIDINGEKTNIRVKGRIRPADIASDNSIPSTRLADAMIGYDGVGYVSDTVQPGWIPKLWNWVKLW